MLERLLSGTINELQKKKWHKCTIKAFKNYFLFQKMKKKLVSRPEKNEKTQFLEKNFFFHTFFVF